MKHLVQLFFLLFLGSFLCSCATRAPSNSILSVEKFAFPEAPLLEKSVRLGGFSGLSFQGQGPDGSLNFLTHTDRGPNLESSSNKEERPFVIPSFQPEWVYFVFDGKKISWGPRTKLTSMTGKPLSGLPNLIGKDGDETPVDDHGKKLSTDPLGIDPESIVQDSDGTYWMGEEYRPSVLHFSKDGKLISRWVPEGTDPQLGESKLPAHDRRRAPNRGFEGIAMENDSLFLFLQSPLREDQAVTRILEINKKSGKVIEEYAYNFTQTPQGWPIIDKIGDAVSIGNGKFLVVEQNSGTGPQAFRRIFEIQTRHTSSVLNVEHLPRSHLCSALHDRSCITPVFKREIADLTTLGMQDVEKIEGITLVDRKTLALVNDNDFGVGSSTEKKSLFFLIHLSQPLE